MPSSATPSLLRASLKFSNSGVEIVNVFNGLIGDGAGAVIASPTEADLRKVADLMAFAWVSTVAARAQNQLQLDEVTVVQATAASPLGVTATVSDLNHGRYGGDEGLQAASAVARWRTGIARRGSNGRTFWSGLAAGDTADGRTLTPTAQGLWATNTANFYNLLLTASTRATLVPTDYSITIDNASVNRASLTNYTFGLKVLHKTGVAAGTFSDIVGVAVANEIGIQRRRMN
jgi:hypothetical protein